MIRLHLAVGSLVLVDLRLLEQVDEDDEEPPASFAVAGDVVAHFPRPVGFNADLSD